MLMVGPTFLGRHDLRGKVKKSQFVFHVVRGGPGEGAHLKGHTGNRKPQKFFYFFSFRFFSFSFTDVLFPVLSLLFFSFWHIFRYHQLQ